MAGGNSYNGWPASDSPSAIGIDSQFGKKVGAPPFGSGGYPGGIKSGDVSTLFVYLINRLHNEVEPMMTEGGNSGYGCWGYSYRANVNNPSQLSCHASGTAIDYNAPKHPNGTSTGPSGGGGWSSSQYAKVQEILKACSGAIRWLTSNDPMHFEIYGSASTVAAAAKKVAGSTPEPEPDPIPDGDKDMALIITASDETRPHLFMQGSTAIQLTSGDSTEALKKSGVPFAMIKAVDWDKIRAKYEVEPIKVRTV